MTQRLRLSALICFTFAVAIYAAVVSIRADRELLNSLAALGAAWWVVSFGLLVGSVFVSARSRASS